MRSQILLADWDKLVDMMSSDHVVVNASSLPDIKHGSGLACSPALVIPHLYVLAEA